MLSLLKILFKLPRPAKRAVSIVLDTCFIFAAFWGAWIFRLDSASVFYKQESWLLFAIVLPVTLIAFIRLGLYRAVLRYMSSKVAVAILIGVSVSVFTLVMAGFFTGYSLPRTVPLIYAAFLLIFVGGSRFTVRALAMQGNKRNKERVLIYGAGSAGRQLAQSLMHGGEYDPVGFIDDDKSLQNTNILGRSVYAFERLSELLESGSIRQVLLAIPRVSRSERSIIISKLEPLAVEIRSIPGVSDLVSGQAKIDELRDVAIEDLLGREPVEPRSDLMSKNIAGKVVMVTGAGGSIGSELCRQIIQQEPKVLLLFELSEFALYKIDGELTKLINRQSLSVELKPIIGSVQKKNRIATVMKTFGVQTVYHAAAYKHVPLVEYNVVEGVRNNVFGTFYSAQAAADANVETFVLISTDKAVRPTNVMGATKRLAELSLQALAKLDTNTTFCMVRFGNVLGSSGSVVPLFREQIRKGGPVTVTHKDITRFFMTIPEASQLVIQAGAMAKGGDVFVLDMGEPIKIAEFAVKMIHLMGLEVKSVDNPHGDIEINYTGLRPGEKLYEELLVGDNVYATEHARIMTANEHSLSWQDMSNFLNEFDQACHDFEIEKVQALLQSAPTAYSPSSDLNDLVWRKKAANKL
ncbi:polysaccharide biosynthesis protein [Eionea flava]